MPLSGYPPLWDQAEMEVYASAMCGTSPWKRDIYPSLTRSKGHSRNWHGPLHPMARRVEDCSTGACAFWQHHHQQSLGISAWKSWEEAAVTQVWAAWATLVFPSTCCWAATGASADTGRNSLASLLEINHWNNTAVLSQWSNVAERTGKPPKRMMLLKLGR